MLKIALCGACGRMGKTIVRQLLREPDMKLVAAIDAPGTPFEGKDAGEVAGEGETGVRVVGAEKLEQVLRETKPDVLVDFTAAEATVENVRVACSLGISVVVGTTGFTPKQLEEIRECVRKSGVRAVLSPNMSVGMNAVFELLEDASAQLPDYDVEIVEAHHAKKRDAPSGTAVRMADLIEQKTGRRPRIHSIRAGEIVGDHTVIFAGPGERVEIIHRAQGREAFAAGLIKVIRGLFTKGRPGEVLGSREVLF
jgi:4-hydroxy-tetrahydrodipicolinate reductase